MILPRPLPSVLTTVTRRPSLWISLRQHFWLVLQGFYEHAKGFAFGPHHRNQTPIVVDFVAAALWANISGYV